MSLNRRRTDRPLALVLFTRQLSALDDAGLSLAHALAILASDAPFPYGEAADRIASRMGDRPDGENTLSIAMGEEPELFSPFFVRMIHVGEIGGIMGVVFGLLADLLDDSYQITSSMSGREKGLPWLFNPDVRMPTEAWEELDDYQRDLTLMLFCRALGVMLSAGVPPLIALEEAAELLPRQEAEGVRRIARAELPDGATERYRNSLRERHLRSARATLPGAAAEPASVELNDDERQVSKAGFPAEVAGRMAHLGFLPKLVTQLMEVGDKEGVFDQMMERAANVYRHALLHRLM